jgi:hypothetical protein
MLGIFGDNPHMPRTPPRGTHRDLVWWEQILSRAVLYRTIPGPCEVIDCSAFSDASSGTGVAIVIQGRWRAWRLLPGWKSSERDIGWAEAIGFEFLVRSLIQTGHFSANTHLKVFGDNTGVVEGWWNGRSRNHEVNFVFRRIHVILAQSNHTIHSRYLFYLTQILYIQLASRYVATGANPADAPSRGKYPPHSLLLPPITIPDAVSPYIIDFDAPYTHVEHAVRRRGQADQPLPKTHSLTDEYRAESNNRFDAYAHDLFDDQLSWWEY